MRGPWPDAAVEALELPVEELGMRVLARLVASDRRRDGVTTNRSPQLVEWVLQWGRQPGDQRHATEVLQANRDPADALGEAWDWLCAEGLLARAVKVQTSPDSYYVTRRGHDLLEYLEPLDMLRAQRRLGVELHTRLAARLRPLIRVGAFEQAAFDALREVEVRVRELAGTKRAQSMVGVGLMRYAFGDEGPLGQFVTDPGERAGLRDLFSGAFGAVRNPLGDRSVQWDDATEAAEMVLLADLLMRQLDRVDSWLDFQREIALDSGDFD
jgi:uncharacterized protein (TIGR02391 family)